MRVLMIEDDQIIADFVSRGLRDAGFGVDHVSDGDSGLQCALSNEYDLAVIDLMLPKLDGITVIERIRARHIVMPIVILSARRSVDDRIRGLQRGGDDYLTKPFSFSELLARIQAVLRRTHHGMESSQLDIDDLSLDLLARTVMRDGRKIDLQPKEFALLEYLVRNAGHVVSKTMIMERVWDYHFDPGTNVVEARISKLREKIDKNSLRPLIETVRGLGYVIRRQTH
jgi:two-component system OmpR family response regulator